VGFAEALPTLIWWPTDPNPNHLRSIEAWRRHTGMANVAPPFALDVVDPEARLDGEGRPPEALAAVISMNVIHIAPWSVCEGIMRIAGRHLVNGGFVGLYGPFKRGGEHTSPSNAAFDASLRRENPQWGVRDLEAVEDAAIACGLHLSEVVEMPANNLTLCLSGPDEADHRLLATISACIPANRLSPAIADSLACAKHGAQPSFPPVPGSRRPWARPDKPGSGQRRHVWFRRAVSIY
jgi:hypothetical protein